MANSTPSKTPVWQANNTGTVNKYAAPPNNGNRQPLSQTNTISTQDYTGRSAPVIGANAVSTQANPQPDANAANDLSSPITLSATIGNSTLLVIPPNAINITLVSTAAFNFSEVGTGGAALTQYVTWPPNTPVTIETARISQLLVSGTGVSQLLSFFFAIM
jgi:hypothetical protein